MPRLCRSRTDQRQVDLNRRPGVRTAQDVYETVMLLDDTISDGKTEACSFADLLGGEKGFENPHAGCFIHPCSIIANGKQGIAAGFTIAVDLEKFVVKFRFSRRYGKHSS